MPNRNDILKAMKKIDAEGLPSGSRAKVRYYVAHPDSGAKYPLKALWRVATGLKPRRFHTYKAMNNLKDLGFAIEDQNEDLSGAGAFEQIPDGKEGASIQVTSNRYERDPKLRSACIKHYVEKDGRLACQVCGMDFESRYGEIGHGFIHIHHVNPLGDGEGERAVDPTRDLVPVCPNCHAMLHKKPGKGAYKIKKLKKKLRKRYTNPGN